MAGNKVFFLLCCCSILLTGCWDSVELEERSFIYGIAIDLAEKEPGGENVLTMTDQIVVPAGLGGTTNNGNSEQQAYRNITKSGKTLVDINRELSRVTNRTLYAQQLNVILLSEEAAKQSGLLKEALDVFIREREMRRGIRLVITKGKASDFLEIKPEDVQIPSEYIHLLLKNKRNAGTIAPLRIGEVHDFLLRDYSFPIPYLVLLDDQNIEYAGVAAYNGKREQVVGIVNGEETKGLGLFTGKISGGSIEIDVEGEKAAIDIMEIAKSLRLNGKDKENLTFNVDLNITASIAETMSPVAVTNLEKYEKAVREKVRELAEKTIAKAQKELATDIFGISSYLNGHHYKLWQEIKEDWDTGENYFARSEFYIRVNISVNHPGNTNKTHKEGKG